MRLVCILLLSAGCTYQSMALSDSDLRTDGNNSGGDSDHPGDVTGDAYATGDPGQDGDHGDPDDDGEGDGGDPGVGGGDPGDGGGDPGVGGDDPGDGDGGSGCPPDVKITFPAENTAVQFGLTVSGSCAVNADLYIAGDIQTPTILECTTGTFTLPLQFTGSDGTKLVSVVQTQGTTCSSNDSRTFAKKFCSETALDAASFAGGSGVDADPYVICTKAQLEILADNSPHWSDHFRLRDDIVLSSVSTINLARIGVPTTPFTGSFDGAGHSIANLRIQQNTPGVGLFGALSSATVSNLVLDSPILNGMSNGSVGAIAGQAVNATIENVSVTNASVSGNQNIGGLVGTLSGGSVANGSVTATTVDGTTNVGGLVGNVSAPVLDSWSDATVTAEDSAGGIAGTIGGSAIERCYATGAVTATTGVAGGILGTMPFGSLYDSYSHSPVIGPSAAGGVVGQMAGGTVARSYHALGVMTSGGGAVGGIVGNRTGGTIVASYFTGGSENAFGTEVSTLELATQSTFATWDFATIWTMDAAYPILQWQP